MREEGQKGRNGGRKKGKGGGRAVSAGGLSERLVAWPEGEMVNGSHSAGRRGELWSGCGCQSTWLCHTHTQSSDHRAFFSHGI